MSDMDSPLGQRLRLQRSDKTKSSQNLFFAVKEGREESDLLYEQWPSFLKVYVDNGHAWWFSSE